MLIPVPSQHKAFSVRIGIRAYEPLSLGIVAYDPERINTDYIRRKVNFRPEHFKGKKTAYQEYTLPFPLSPDQLMVELYDKSTGLDQKFSIETMKIEALPIREVWAEPEVHRFIDFAQDFSVKAGYASTGVYDSPTGEFLVQYLPTITNELGRSLVTPARINRRFGRIQVSQREFIKYTIPVRIVVLLHERYHFQLPTRLEKPADLNAIRLYLDLGFPRTEAVYAVTRIFLSHPESVGPGHLKRVHDVCAFIDDYSKKHGKKLNNQA